MEVKYVKKVLQINSVDIGGGAARVAFELNNYINKFSDSYKSSMLVGRKKNISNNLVYSFSSKYEIYGNAFLTRLLGIDSTYYFLKNANEMIKFINSYNTIHFHNLHGYYFPIKLLRDINTDVIKVWTLHDMWPITGRCAAIYECDQWKNGCGNCLYKREYPKTLIDISHYNFKLKKKIIKSLENLFIATPSKWLKGIISKSYLNVFPIYHIPNGVDISVFYPRNKELLRKKYEIPSNRKVIMFVSEKISNTRKGFQLLLNTLELIKSKRNYILVTIGNKLDKHYYVGTLSDYKIIEFGYISDVNKMAEMYSLADLFILPSLGENLPCTIQEAMACGTPCVAFDVGGVSELIIEGRTGNLATPKDTKQLANIIDYILSDSNLRENYSKNSVSLISEAYTLEQMVKKYVELYSSKPLQKKTEI
jgi:glycosyltransferase involved in cell wall biosynthesis